MVPPRVGCWYGGSGGVSIGSDPSADGEVISEVTLAAPPPLAAAEEAREAELPASLGGGLHGSPLSLEPKASVGDVAGTKSERPVAARATEVVDILSNDEADVMVELSVSSWELAVV